MYVYVTHVISYKWSLRYTLDSNGIISSSGVAYNPGMIYPTVQLKSCQLA